ncbi:5,6-dimethylbenzimidazole synthase [Marinomonas agarivorans]|nr:5,6-dimethylbenzimidazole synthase [Marinomonas agarivorans]
MTANLRFDQETSDLLEQIIRHRRDVRGNRFLSTPIEQGHLDKILQAGLHAPSVGFSQPWEFVLIENQNTKQAVAASFKEENDKAQQTFATTEGQERQALYQSLKLEGIHESPLNIAVLYKPQDKPILGQTSMTDMGRFSVVCAVQNMWLMARALNIGIGWVSIVNPEKVKTAIDAPTDRELIAYLCVGYVDKFYDKPELETLAWEQRRQTQQVIFKESYQQHENN